jgi:hypothetical protein
MIEPGKSGDGGAGAKAPATAAVQRIFDELPDEASGEVPTMREAAIEVVASAHKLQDGRHDTPKGLVLVNESALLALGAAISKRGENAP